MSSRKIKNRIRTTSDKYILAFVSVIYLGIAAIICTVPFLLIVSGSLTDNMEVIKNGFSLIPKNFSLEAYKLAFKSPETVGNAYLVSTGLLIVGTVLGLSLTTMTGYALCRMDSRISNKISFFFYFTTMFGGGLVPWYILMVRYLGLKNNFLALLLPPLLNVFYIFIMRNFIKGIPSEIMESAKIDGAGEMTTFIRIVLPLLTPILATIGLYLAVGYWNDWFNAMLYINKPKMYPLQYMLYQMLMSIEAMTQLSSSVQVPMPELPTETFKMVITVIAIGPIVLVYPFAQKFFIKGLTMGSVKG